MEKNSLDCNRTHLWRDRKAPKGQISDDMEIISQAKEQSSTLCFRHIVISEVKSDDLASCYKTKIENGRR